MKLGEVFCAGEMNEIPQDLFCNLTPSVSSRTQAYA